MTKSKESFLPKSIIPTLPPGGDCFPSPLPWPWPMPWPGDLIGEGLATRAAIRAVRYQLPAMRTFSADAQEATIAGVLDGLQQDGLLTASEVESLRGVSEGRAFTVPLFNPDGSPSLCGVLGKLMTPSPERSTASTILGGAIGAGAGALVGGAPGAVLGALAGGIVGSMLE